MCVARRVKDVFDKIDEDGSGSIDESELAKLLGGIGYNTKTKVSAATLIKEMDDTGDGEITFEQFEGW